MNHAERDQVSKILAQLSAHCFVGGGDNHTMDLISQAQEIVDAPMETYLWSPDQPDPPRPTHMQMVARTAAPSQCGPYKVDEVLFLDTPSRGVDLDYLERTWAHRDWAERARKRLITVVLSILIAVALIAAALSGDSGPSTEQPPSKVEDTVRAKLPTRTAGIGPRHAYGAAPYQPRHAYSSPVTQDVLLP